MLDPGLDPGLGPELDPLLRACVTKLSSPGGPVMPKCHPRAWPYLPRPSGFTSNEDIRPMTPPPVPPPLRPRAVSGLARPPPPWQFAYPRPP